MTKRSILWVLPIITIISYQCSVNTSSSSVKDDSRNLNQINTDSILNPVTIKYAKNFSVAYHNNYKVAHIHFSSEQRDIQFDQKIVMVHRGAPVPELAGDLTDAWILTVPLQTVAANDDGEITRLKALSLTKNIVAMGGGGIYDPELRKRWEAKQIASIGYSFHSPPQPEVILTLKPDILLLYAYNHHRLESLAKLRQLGINAIPQFAWAEPSFLGKAEWIKFTAMFFNEEHKANDIFQHVDERCQELMQLAAMQESKKRAFLVYHPSDKSDWNAHRNDFYASFLEAAGSDNVLKDNGPTHAVGMNSEMLLSLAKDADFWFVNSVSDQSWPPANYLRSFKAYRNHNVYHYQKRTRYEHNAYDWYETPEVRPDLVLEDLVSIFYPELLPEHELLFFDQVELNK